MISIRPYSTGRTPASAAASSSTPETRVAARVERTAARRTREAQREQLARGIERAAAIAARALGTKLDAAQFAEIIKSQELDARLKALRIKTGRETFKV